MAPTCDCLVRARGLRAHMQVSIVHPQHVCCAEARSTHSCVRAQPQLDPGSVSRVFATGLRESSAKHDLTRCMNCTLSSHTLTGCFCGLMPFQLLAQRELANGRAESCCGRARLRATSGNCTATSAVRSCERQSALDRRQRSRQRPGIACREQALLWLPPPDDSATPASGTLTVYADLISSWIGGHAFKVQCRTC